MYGEARSAASSITWASSANSQEVEQLPLVLLECILNIPSPHPLAGYKIRATLEPDENRAELL